MPAAEPARSARPNIIFILIDDMGYGDLGCYGNAGVRTSHIDRLAAEGIRFTQYYVNAPICSPSRVAVTTGQYPARWRITSYLAERKANTDRGMVQFLSTDAPTLPRMLSQAGYDTAHIGKWHMGGQRDVGEAPLIAEYGFRESVTQFEGLGERFLPIYETRQWNGSGRYRLGVGSEQLDQGPVHWVKRHEVTSRFVDRAIEAIRRAQREQRPFYINLWPDDVHSPHEAPPELRGDGSVRAHYLGVIRELDAQLGRLFEVIRNDPSLRDNTLILLASDNGPEEGIGQTAGLRGSKGNLYEGGIREPLIVWWPGGIPAAQCGRVNETTIIAGMDLPPTLLTITGTPQPERGLFDGVDQSAAFRGDDRVRRQQPIHWLRPPDRPGPKDSWPDLAIRKQNWKLLIEEDGSQPQLYDIAADPGEACNVAEQHPELVNRLRDQLLAWRSQMTEAAASLANQAP